MPSRQFLKDRNTGRQYRLNGCIPSERPPNNPRLQQPFRSHMVLNAAQLPDKVDLRPDMTPVEDQSTLGSCVANAFAGAYEYLLKKATGSHIDVSRLFIYYNARVKYNGSEKDITDSGSTLTNGIEALNEFGTCLESVWPYDIDAVDTRPNAEAYEKAKAHHITRALEVDVDLNEMKTCLAQGFPFAFGVRLYESFNDAAESGVVQKPESTEAERGAHGIHAMLAVGYSDAQQAFIVRNSWGEDWGQQGYCYMSYDYLTNPDYVFELWTIRKLETDDMGHEHWSNEDNRRGNKDTGPTNYSYELDYNPEPNQNEYDKILVPEQYEYDSNSGYDLSNINNNSGYDPYKIDDISEFDPYKIDNNSGFDPYTTDNNSRFNQFEYVDGSGYDPYKNDNTSGFDQYEYDPYKNTDSTGFDQYGYGKDSGFNQFEETNNPSYNQSNFDQFGNTDNSKSNQFRRNRGRFH